MPIFTTSFSGDGFYAKTPEYTNWAARTNIVKEVINGKYL